VDNAEAKRRFDLQTQTRKSRTAICNAKPVVRAAGGSTHQLSREGKLLQEKAADKL
jgi:hypothetical protein